MHQDVVDLRAFYYRTKLGRSAQRALQEALTAIWPDTTGLTVAGFGFAVPVLRPFLGRSHRVLSLMPAQQGMMPWPTGAPNVTALVEETHWPIAAGSVDRLIVAHGLETCERPGELLDEVWRVLRHGGYATFIVPNRSGLWARRDATPFGNGRPYTFGQLEALLSRHRFQSTRHAAALYTPPSHSRFWLQTAGFWERIGRRYDPQVLAGALLVEATKHVHVRPPQEPARSVLPRPLDVLEGLTGTNPNPVPGHSRLRASAMVSFRPDLQGIGAPGSAIGVLPCSKPSAITAPILTNS